MVVAGGEQVLLSGINQRVKDAEEAGPNNQTSVNLPMVGYGNDCCTVFIKTSEEESW